MKVSSERNCSRLTGSRHARTLAVPGARIAALPAKAVAAVTEPVDYVTLLVGANDACSGEMTSAAAFRAPLDQALATLKRGRPDARLLLVGIPDVYRVWE